MKTCLCRGLLSKDKIHVDFVFLFLIKINFTLVFFFFLVGEEDEISIKDVAELVVKSMNFKGKVVVSF